MRVEGCGSSDRAPVWQVLKSSNPSAAKKKTRFFLRLGMSLVVEHLPRMRKALIQSPTLSNQSIYDLNFFLLVP
jgi:hypothetical protein